MVRPFLIAPPGPALGGVGPIVLRKSSSVLLCVLENPRVDKSSEWPISVGPYWDQLVLFT